MNVVHIIQTAYLGASAAILLIRTFPPFRDRFLDYGARASKVAERSRTKDERKTAAEVALLDTALDRIAAIRVPHSWFAMFYALSVISSLFWAHQLLYKGSAFQFIASKTQISGRSMGIQQIIVVWTMMFVQGLRRLDESITMSKPSTSTMFVAHWMTGLFFYAITGMATWIEGTNTLRANDIKVQHLHLTAPGLHVFFGVLLFILSSGIQRDCHAYLYSLKTYQVPTHPIFHRIVCPHYLAECIIYLAISIAAAPTGAMINRTLACGVIFVVVNLGVTAAGTKDWYASRFGKASVASKWRMIPGVF